MNCSYNQPIKTTKNMPQNLTQLRRMFPSLFRKATEKAYDRGYYQALADRRQADLEVNEMIARRGLRTENWIDVTSA